MAWRKQATHQEETKAVKAALRSQGIHPVSVGHGAGTAWGWLEINLGDGAPYDLQRKAIGIAQEVTGRSGEYNGEILVLAQGR